MSTSKKSTSSAALAASERSGEAANAAGEYKLSIIEQADLAQGAGGVGALLRREGLYSSHLATWRQQRKQGEFDALTAKKRGPKVVVSALCALARYYGKNLVYSGPTLESVERLPGSIRLHFTHTDGGLVVKGDKLEEFTIAGDDRKWVWADARIDGDTVVVSSPSVASAQPRRQAEDP
jgi:hypothetical protein